MNTNPIEVLRDIRAKQHKLGKDIAAYTGIACMTFIESANSGNKFLLPIAIGAGYMSFSSCIAYDSYVSAGDKLQEQFISEMTAPC